MKTALPPSSTKRKPRIRLSGPTPSTTKKDQKPVALLELEQLAWKIDFIVQNIKYPEAFVKDLVKSFRAMASNGSIQPLLDCLRSWEATAELDASPPTRKRILKAYSDLRSGKIKTTRSRKKFLEKVNAD